MVRQERAEIFALPSADTPPRPIAPFALAHSLPRLRFVVLIKGANHGGCALTVPPPMKTKSQILVAISSLLLSAAADGQTQLKFWLPSSINAHEKAAYTQTAEEFSKKNPSIKVNIETMPGSETDVAKLMTAVRSGAGPDLAVIDRFTVAQRAAAGLLTDLTPLIKKEGKDLSREYTEGPWQEVTYDGKTYALPTETDARVLFYNKKILRDAGIDLSEFDPAHGPISPERFKEIALKLNQTDASGAYTRLGFVPWLEQGWGYTWGFAFGGSFFDFKNCKVTATDPGVVNGYQFLYDFAKALDPQKARNFCGYLLAVAVKRDSTGCANAVLHGKSRFRHRRKLALCHHENSSS
jgi:multiple sugar transport system substrate-binding protein